MKRTVVTTIEPGEPDIEYYVRRSGEWLEQRTSDATLFTTLQLCRECSRFLPAKPSHHMALHKAKHHGSES